jgi:hypothetical protein
MTYPRGIAYHEAGHAVVAWALGLRVGISRPFYDDVTGWQGETKIDDASRELSLTEKIALRASGYTAEKVFRCPAHEQAVHEGNLKIYRLLMDKGIAEADHPPRVAEGNAIARAYLEAHRSQVIALAEHLAECGHVDDASKFLESLR